MLKNRIIYSFALAATLFIAACETERDPCLQPTEVFVRARFSRLVTDTGKAVVDTFFANMLFNPVDIPTLYTDTGITNTNPFPFRLSQQADSCRYYITPDSSRSNRRDTVTFFYKRNLKFLSNACGYTYHFEIDSIRSTKRGIADTIHAIDSIVLLNNNINGEANKEHLRFYFHKQ